MQQTAVGEEASKVERNLLGTDNCRYGRLKEGQFRILELFPGAQGDPIRCHLHRHPIDKCPSFEAFILHLGEGEPRSETISVNDEGLAITPNLYSALQELRGDLMQPLPEDSSLKFAVLLDRFKFISRQQDTQAFIGDGLKLLAECFGQGLAEYITFCASQGQEPLPREVESKEATTSRYVDAVGADKSELDRILSQRMKRIEELWDTYVTEEGKAILMRTPRFLWVDAVCIHQSDFEERSTQLLLMGKIYKSARRLCRMVESRAL